MHIYKPITIYKQKLFYECKEKAPPLESKSPGEGEDLMIKTEDIHIKVERLESEILELGNNQGKLRREIAELREYIQTKDNGRMDFDYLAVMLKKELLKRGRGMDYKSVSDFFHFSPQEAYRLMEKTIKNFPFDVEIKIIKNSNKKKKIIIAMH